MNTAKLTVLYKGRFRASDSKDLINSASAWNLAITNQLPDFASHTLSTLKSKASFRRPFSAIGSATQIEPWALSEQPDGWGTSRAADPLAELDRHRAIGLTADLKSPAATAFRRLSFRTAVWLYMRFMPGYRDVEDLLDGAWARHLLRNGLKLGVLRALPWDRGFDSHSLQRRVCELLVPKRRARSSMCRSCHIETRTRTCRSLWIRQAVLPEVRGSRPIRSTSATMTADSSPQTAGRRRHVRAAIRVPAARCPLCRRSREILATSTLLSCSLTDRAGRRSPPPGSSKVLVSVIGRGVRQ